MGLFLRADPLLNGGAAVEGLSTYACAGRPLAAGFPPGQRVSRQAQRPGQLLSADPVCRQVRDVLVGIGLNVLDRLLYSRGNLLAGVGSAKQRARIGRQVEGGIVDRLPIPPLVSLAFL